MRGRPWKSDDLLGLTGASSMDTSAELDAEFPFDILPGAMVASGGGMTEYTRR